MKWPGHKFAAGMFAAVLLVFIMSSALLMAASRADNSQSGKLLAVFHPSTSADVIFENIIRAGAKPVRATWMPGTWIIQADTPGIAGKLEQAGAIGAYTSSPILPQLAGCFAYVDAKLVRVFAINQ